MAILIFQLTRVQVKYTQGNYKSSNISVLFFRKKNSISPEEAVERLRVIIELLERLLSNKEFDEDFQEELSAACPNYMDVLQTYKRDLLRNDCGIIIAGM